jgi:hypothetical protein
MAKTFSETKMKTKFYLFITVVILAASSAGCNLISTATTNLSSIAGLNDTATVIVRRANLRSSYAVVAADLLEVQRGNVLDILEEVENETDKVRWFRVRSRDDEDSTEGWIEAQNVITGTLLEKSKKLAEESKDLQPQAKAQLKAVSNLRLTPEVSKQNILVRLENGASFDVIGWKYVVKAEEPVADDKQVEKRPKTKNEEVEAAKEADKPEELDEKYDVWYRVRLATSQSPVPEGWLFGRQVDLQVPSDIAFFQLGATKFVTFQRLDDIVEETKKDKEDLKVSKPGNWVILSRSNRAYSNDGSEPDFDGIMVLGYDKYNQEFYPVYKKGEVYKRGEVLGSIPLKIEGVGDNKTFTLKIRNAGGQLEDKRFVVSKETGGRLKVTPPVDMIPVDDTKKK